MNCSLLRGLFLNVNFYTFYFIIRIIIIFRCENKIACHCFSRFRYLFQICFLRKTPASFQPPAFSISDIRPDHARNQGILLQRLICNSGNLRKCLAAHACISNLNILQSSMGKYFFSSQKASGFCTVKCITLRKHIFCTA